MAEEIRVSRPMQPGTPMRNDGMGMAPEGKSGSKAPWIIVGLIVVVAVVLGVLFRDKLFPGNKGAVKGVATGASGYQAVFLTNGQVYFGKIANATGDYLVMGDIYYLQVTQPPLQGSTEQGQQAQQQPQISLVKLGNELHGPMDEMHINRQQVLFYEDLKEEGQVVKAIRDYKK